MSRVTIELPKWLPPAYDLIWSSLLLMIAVLTVCALVQLFHAESRSLVAKVVWVLAILLFPVLGPIAWFAFGKRSLRKRAHVKRSLLQSR